MMEAPLFLETHGMGPLRNAVGHPDTLESTDLSHAFAKSWQVIVWNDPINLMSYVVYVFKKVLGFGEPLAKKHMLEVHQQGRSCVARETREKAEHLMSQLRQHGLQVTLESKD
ncbi:MAG: ATP-dependent Clp protease adapter ClpS [Candidatus Methylacidiphilales bacterium]